MLEILKEHKSSVIKITPIAIDPLEVNNSNLGTLPESLNEILNQDNTIVDHYHLNINDNAFTVTIERRGNSPFYDEVRFKKNNGLNEQEAIKIISKISSDLHAFDPERKIYSPIPEQQQQLFALNQSSLDRLENLNIDLIEKGQEFLKAIDDKVVEKIGVLEEDFSKKESALKEEFSKKEQELQKKEEALTARAKEIDDRDNTHVRRQLRQDLIQEIKDRSEKFNLTKGTVKLRWPVHGACCILIALLGGGAIAYATVLFELLVDSPIDITAVTIVSIKQLGLTLGAAATAFFYIRWLNRWFEQHAQAEFQLKQFQLDIDRASWVVETALEWRKSGEGSLPNELLESMSRNLFVTDDYKVEQLKHPADELASALLGTASKVRLKAGDSELELDGKRLSKGLSND